MIAKFVKTSLLLFVCSAAASSAIAAPVAAAQYSLPPALKANLSAELRAALQQTASRNAGATSSCASLAQPRPQGCTQKVALLGGLDWIEQTLVGDDIGPQSMFGTALSLDGNTAVIGAIESDPLQGPVDVGAAYVFTRTPSGWQQTQKLVADDSAFGDNFGIAVAVQGETLLVGAYKATIDGDAQQGAVYVFRPVAGVWTQTQKLTPADAGAGRLFGAWISLDGPHALVSTPAGMMGDDTTTSPVYALQETDGTWAISQTLNADDYAPGDIFGFQTALKGDTALIGAAGAAIDGNAAQGAAYVFNYANGSWTQGEKLTVTNGGEMELFGWAVAIDGPTALISAPFTTVGDNMMQGAAYLFALEDGSWYQTQKLTQTVGMEMDRFGSTLALSGNIALIGTPWLTEIDGASVYGAAWIYTGSGEDGFVQQSLISPPTPEVTSFAYAVTMNNGRAMIGAPIDGTDNTGYAVIYEQDRIMADGFDGDTP